MQFWCYYVIVYNSTSATKSLFRSKFKSHDEFEIVNDITGLFYCLFPTSATQETLETSKTESGFVEIGYISNVHGLEGEIRVKTSTGFPELRFSKVKQILFFRILLEPLIWSLVIEYYV